MKTATLFVDDSPVIESVFLATGLWDRMRGLLGRSGLPRGVGMYLSPCGSIHTIGMRFAIDVIFLGRGHRIVRVVRNVPPLRMVGGGWGARHAVEVASGWLDTAGVPVGAFCRLA